jgi:hypothetical protein
MPMAEWTLKVRAGGKVDRSRHADMKAALTAIEARGRELERTADAKPRAPFGRTFEPVQQVVARLELSGPGRVRAGVDIRGDGSAESWTGRLRRDILEQRRGESPYDALRRAVSKR